MRLFTLIAIALFAVPRAFASTNHYSHSIPNESSIVVDDIGTRWENALGTFQLEIIKSRKLPQIDISIIDEIETQRHATQIIYISYSENIRIKVLPYSMLEDGNPGLELRVYVDSFSDQE